MAGPGASLGRWLMTVCHSGLSYALGGRKRARDRRESDGRGHEDGKDHT